MIQKNGLAHVAAATFGVLIVVIGAGAGFVAGTLIRTLAILVPAAILYYGAVWIGLIHPLF